jgi:hypothetical protein
MAPQFTQKPRISLFAISGYGTKNSQKSDTLLQLEITDIEMSVDPLQHQS